MNHRRRHELKSHTLKFLAVTAIAVAVGAVIALLH